jgi:hypothetical protein
MTEKRNHRELLWFQAGGALNFITAAPHCGDLYIIFVWKKIRMTIMFMLRMIMMLIVMYMMMTTVPCP